MHVGVTVTANVNEFTAMIGACNTHGVCNVLRDIDRVLCIVFC